MPELVWNGKYTSNHQLIVPPRVALPFQTVEVIADASTHSGTAYIPARDRTMDWHNRLIWGDRKYVLPSLYPEFAGSVKLIYIDPPFAPVEQMSSNLTDKDTKEPFVKHKSVIEQKAYYDMYGHNFDLDKYLQWFYETALLLKDLLSADGCLYVHSDWRLNSHIRLVLDEIFGSAHHGNEIIWHYQSGGRQKNKFSRKHDSIYLYMRSDNWTFNADKVGAVRGKGKRNNMKRDVDTNGKVYFSISSGNRIYRYSEDDLMTPFDVWTDISHIHQKDPQRVGYSGQKPEALLERIILASSDEDDLVLDCFCGSGTTAAMAEKLGRRWIASDISRFAVHTTRERLLRLGHVHPFFIQNIGNYERQIWQNTQGEPERDELFIKKQMEYRHFMLDLYRAQPLQDFVWIHGIREGRFIHIGSIDAPISRSDILSLVAELRVTYGQDAQLHIDVLGWDFAFDLDTTIHQIERESQVQITCRRIPRELLERAAREEVDIHFFELAALDVEIFLKDTRVITVTLTDFLVPMELVPDTIRQTLPEWHQWIDYWAIDWNYDHGIFHNMTQIYRTKKDVILQTHMSYTYGQEGTYTIAIKVIDLLGNDTTVLREVEVH